MADSSVESFIELHLHTCYSFLEGASQPEELADRAAELGYAALAITDHDGLHGAMAFAQDNTFVELQHNLVQGDTRRLARLAELAERLRLPVVATGNVHYHDRERHRLQDAMVAVKHRTTLEASHRLRRPNSEFYLRSP